MERLIKECLDANDHNRSQAARMLKDLMHCSNQPMDGVYKGIKWKITRPTGSHLCGYIIVPKTTVVDFDGLDDIAHGGITGGCRCNEDEESFGFDCAHAGDWIPSFGAGLAKENNWTYKNYDYVLNNIKEMIDFMG